MNIDLFKGHWHIVIGRVKQAYGQLSHDELAATSRRPGAASGGPWARCGRRPAASLRNWRRRFDGQFSWLRAFFNR